jgi:hypothetical protein
LPHAPQLSGSLARSAVHSEAGGSGWGAVLVLGAEQDVTARNTANHGRIEPPLEKKA